MPDLCRWSKYRSGEEEEDREEEEEESIKHDDVLKTHQFKLTLTCCDVTMTHERFSSNDINNNPTLENRMSQL